MKSLINLFRSHGRTGKKTPEKPVQSILTVSTVYPSEKPAQTVSMSVERPSNTQPETVRQALPVAGQSNVCNCGSINRVGAKFCKGCGSKLSQPERPVYAGDYVVISILTRKHLIDAFITRCDTLQTPVTVLDRFDLPKTEQDWTGLQDCLNRDGFADQRLQIARLQSKRLNYSKLGSIQAFEFVILHGRLGKTPDNVRWIVKPENGTGHKPVKLLSVSYNKLSPTEIDSYSRQGTLHGTGRTKSDRQHKKYVLPETVPAPIERKAVERPVNTPVQQTVPAQTTVKPAKPTQTVKPEIVSAFDRLSSLFAK